MATVIRLARHGKRKDPFFRVVVQDSRSPRDGRFIENIGYLNPAKEKDSLFIKRDRLEYWLGTGAQLSVSLRSRLRRKMKEWEQVASPVAPAPAKHPKKTETKPHADKEA